MFAAPRQAKRRLSHENIPGVHGTTSLREVLDDKEIRGVFVAATPSAHFTISRAVLESGKALFVEKPPCTSLDELDCLIETAKSVATAP